MKPWDSLTPDEKMSYVEMIATPGLPWVLRARALYERLRHEYGGTAAVGPAGISYGWGVVDPTDGSIKDPRLTGSCGARKMRVIETETTTIVTDKPEAYFGAAAGIPS